MYMNVIKAKVNLTTVSLVLNGFNISAPKTMMSSIDMPHVR